MTTVGPSVLWVAQVSGPRPDPAFDMRAAGYHEALEQYAKTRRPEDLAKVPCKAGRTPRLYGVQLMTPEVYQAIHTLPADRAVARMHFAVAVTVHAMMESGATTPATFRAGEKLQIADEAWLARLQRTGGEFLLGELAALALRRADLGDWTPEEGSDPLDLYAPPPGMARAPSPT